MKTIPLTKRKMALVDDEDYEWLMQWKWHVIECEKNFYARRNHKGKTIYMHRLIMGACAGQQTDHKNCNGLNNQKQNLRFCSNAQNQYNQKSYIGHTSKFRGVCWHKVAKKWQASIRHHYHLIYLGLFGNEFEAAKAYDRAAVEKYGEYAHLNIPIRQNQDV